MNRMLPLRLGLLALLGLVVAGCTGPGGGWGASQPASRPAADLGPLENNIIGLSCFYPTVSPWIRTQDGSQIRGIVISGLYLQGPKGMGVFGNGTIKPRLLVVNYEPSGKKVYTPVKEWSYNVEQALLWRSKKPNAYGYGYRLHLTWDDTKLDLGGREVRMIVTFERADGRVVGPSRKDFRIPRSG